jgi:hypothetical protein
MDVSVPEKEATVVKTEPSLLPQDSSSTAMDVSEPAPEAPKAEAPEPSTLSEGSTDPQATTNDLIPPKEDITTSTSAEKTA